MAIFYDDTKKCECGSIVFEKKTFVTLRKNPKRLIDDESSDIVSSDILTKKVQYACSKCGKLIDL